MRAAGLARGWINEVCALDERTFSRDLLLGALVGLYGEQPGLIGVDDWESLQGRALRANERAVAARLAVHLDRALCDAASELTVDVEYSRVLQGVAAKMGPSGQIFPDLIVHRRGESDRNALAVELKAGVPTELDEVNKTDDRKMRHLTSRNWMSGQTAYGLGLCLQLAHDRGRLHWYEDGKRVRREEWKPPTANASAGDDSGA